MRIFYACWLAAEVPMNDYVRNPLLYRITEKEQELTRSILLKIQKSSPAATEFFELKQLLRAALDGKISERQLNTLEKIWRQWA